MAILATLDAIPEIPLRQFQRENAAKRIAGTHTSYFRRSIAATVDVWCEATCILLLPN